MTHATTLLRGSMSVIDYRCTALPTDKPFAEQHAAYSVSFVRSGTFGYRQLGRSYELVAGSIMVGHVGDEFMCTHDHHECGDECLSFHLTEEAAHAICPSKKTWRIGAIAPLPQLMVLGELAQAVAVGKSDIGLDEVGTLMVAKVAELTSDTPTKSAKGNARDRKRAVSAALWLDEYCEKEITLDAVAKEAGLSSFHFLRQFSQAVGVTPHQYLLRARVRRAARLLAQEHRSITDIAADVGFADLSNFVRTFHRAAGMSPRQFRQSALVRRKIR